MPVTPRLPQPERPDPAQRLLAAVAEGDSPTARRLGERLVHRLGVEAFMRWQRETLLPGQGEGAVQWLCAQLNLALTVEGASAAPLPDQVREQPLAPLEVIPTIPPVRGAEAIRALPRTESLQSAAPAPATVRRLRSWLRDLPQAG